MPKRTSLLILLLAVATLVLIFVIVVSPSQLSAPNSNKDTSENTTAIKKTAQLVFAPDTVDITASNAAATQSVDLLVASGNNSISGVQVELQYDTDAISDVELTPALESSFGQDASVLFNDLDKKNGKISYAIAINPNSKPRQGLGKIATIKFNKANNAKAIFPSAISYLNGTTVTVLNQDASVLGNAKPLEIRYTK